jgi:hypothetical protein
VEQIYAALVLDLRRHDNDVARVKETTIEPLVFSRVGAVELTSHLQ